jgi:hypothetical protein
MMQPKASVSGLMFAHPNLSLHLGKIGEDQLRDYSRRRGVPVELIAVSWVHLCSGNEPRLPTQRPHSLKLLL